MQVYCYSELEIVSQNSFSIPASQKAAEPIRAGLRDYGGTCFIFVFFERHVSLAQCEIDAGELCVINQTMKQLSPLFPQL
jgi:hypothetical protein